jgi:hypothetical protein
MGFMDPGVPVRGVPFVFFAALLPVDVFLEAVFVEFFFAVAM